MELKQRLALNPDDIADLSEVREIIYECGTLMVRLSSSGEVKIGHQVLDVMGCQKRDSSDLSVLEGEPPSKGVRS